MLDNTGKQATEEFTDPKTSWIQTCSKVKVCPMNPDPATIHFSDIATATSNNCRYTGHVNYFFSVAQHCVLVSYIVADLRNENGEKSDRQVQLAALMHDASEAYLADVATPVKRHLIGYKDWEHELDYVISLRFGLLWPRPPVVKLADDMAFACEVPVLLGEDGPLAERISVFIKPPREELVLPQTPQMAKARFVERFRQLGGKA